MIIFKAFADWYCQKIKIRCSNNTQTVKHFKSLNATLFDAPRFFKWVDQISICLPWGLSSWVPRRIWAQINGHGRGEMFCRACPELGRRGSTWQQPEEASRNHDLIRHCLTRRFLGLSPSYVDEGTCPLAQQGIAHRNYSFQAARSLFTWDWTGSVIQHDQRQLFDTADLNQQW